MASTIQAALAASTLSLFAAITWTVDGAVITATADTAGVPFSCAATTTESGGGAADDQTFVRAASVASVGPYDWNTALNWSGGAVPVNSDDVFIDEGTYDILYGLNQSAVTLDELHVSQLYSGKIGTSTAYLRIGAATAVLGEYFGTGSPTGSRRIKIDFGSSDVDVTVLNSASAAEESNQQPIRLKINHASATLVVLRGKVSLCVGTGETGQVTSITEGFTTNVDRDSEIVVGSGVTVATITKTGGNLLLNAACTTLTQKGGQTTTDGTGAITTMTNYDGTIYPCSTGTIGTLEARGGTIDFTRSTKARTVTTPQIWGGATIVWDKDIVTMTNDPDPQESVRMTCERLYG